ncbi:MAG: peptidyl-prolyl cis-trans isomerase [Poseidonibacter sp.]|uniref:peptidylprolyl isomerase n=1 Tax=Poseidonibacter sp. TaxID=2321188 RepID=UPI00359E1525
MYKLLLSLFICSSLSFASMINGVALTVNDEAITLYDIDKTMSEQNISKNQAVGLLVDKILYEQVIKKNRISVDIFDINTYAEKLANSNNMDVYTFKTIVTQKYGDYSIFEEDAKKVITRQKLIERLVKGQLKIATDEDISIYYDNNKNKFQTAEKFSVVQYSSKRKASLVSTIKSPLIANKEVKRNAFILENENLNPQLQYLLNETKANSFTPIFRINDEFTTIFVIKKEGKSILNYETVKSKIFNDIMETREKKFLKEYFEKEKLTADIKIVR